MHCRYIGFGSESFSSYSVLCWEGVASCGTHSTSLEERDIRRHFPRARVLVADQTTLPSQPLAAQQSAARPRLVFISRISPKKNLHPVLQALGQVRSPLSLDIYGPIEDPSYWNTCQTLISQIEGPIEVSYRGELKPENVSGTFNS